MSDSMRWYGAVTDGGFFDLIDELGQAGAACSGLHPARCAWRGARFTVVHDVEGPVRVYIDDAGPLGSVGVWKMLDSFLVPATHRTGADAISQLGQLGQEAWQKYGPQLGQIGQQAWQEYGPPSWPAQPPPPRSIGKGMQKGMPTLPQLPAMPSFDFDQLSQKLGRGIGGALPPDAPTSIARQFGQQIGEAGKEIARSLPSPHFDLDLDKPAEKIAQALKTAAIVAAVGVVAAVAISAIA
ncbi:MAG TPA: hypothetical protein VFA98_08215, partial [Thermoanaerobaculia bacterium]|nr:hypothetical protein [Thermoanaerobaculia bacterium]